MSKVKLKEKNGEKERYEAYEVSRKFISQKALY